MSIKLKPIIGITLDSSNENTYSDMPWYALRKNYAEEIHKHGGIPILLPYENNLASYYAILIDGLLIPGGDYNLDPALYGETPTRDYDDHNYERVDFETEIIKNMIDLKKPILGICAGMQLIAIKFANGRMIQDISKSPYQQDIHHKQKILNIPMTESSHYIKIEQNTKLARITQEDQAFVNSSHIQAVKSINSDDFIISARAEDGIIEAIEHKSHPFLIGVEWHPEYNSSKIDTKILKAFIEASLNHQNC